MANCHTKRPIEEDSSDSSVEEEENESQDDEEMCEDEELGENDREVQVEFAGQSPAPEDFHGIKALLHQLFLKAHINLNGLTELIIQQNYIGSILQQCVEEDDQDSDDEQSEEEVFGITSVINLSHHKDVECVKQVNKYLLENTQKKLAGLFNDSANKVGLLLNERFINIPPQVSIPLLENLCKEIEEAKKEGKPFDFTHFLLISKLHESIRKDHESIRKDPESKKKKVKGAANILWVNAEEEAISEIGEILGEYSVRNESDAAVSGTWDEEDEQFDPKRRIVLINANQLPEALIKIKEFIE